MHRDLPDVRRAVILTANYGEAGAIDRYGPALGLPRAHSGHNAYGDWGPPPAVGGAPVIAVGLDARTIAAHLRDCRVVARIDNRAGVDNDERGRPLTVCAGPRRAVGQPSGPTCATSGDREAASPRWRAHLTPSVQRRPAREVRASRGQAYHPSGQAMTARPRSDSDEPTEVPAKPRPKRRSITKTHERISQLGWQPSYHQPVTKYPTRYKIPTKAKDPMKQIMREYLPMELEKDERVYGGHDAAVRSGMTKNVSRRWQEILKPFIQVTNFAEVGAGRCMSLLIDAIPNNELRNGYHVQFIDEMRHTGLQMSLARWYTKNSWDPHGWNIGAQGLTRGPVTAPGVNMLSHFMVGDPIQCAFTLQVVAETALTNAAFVALPDVGMRNGDFALPTTYMSVQSDEARHISNGYATLLTVIQEDDNHDLIVRDLQQAWWINHAYLDTFTGAVCEYFSRGPQRPRVLPGQVGPLDPRRLVPLLHHEAGQVRRRHPAGHVPPGARAHRQGPDDPQHDGRLRRRGCSTSGASTPTTTPTTSGSRRHYPGWYEQYGPFFEGHKAMIDPRDGQLMIKQMGDAMPPMCFTCQLPAVIEEDVCHRIVDPTGATCEADHADARTRFYCSPECRWLDESNPGRYMGDRQWFDRYDGWELSEIVRDMGFVRPDGQTLIGQPHCSDDVPLWTLKDLERCGVEIQSPNKLLAQKMGLPNGLAIDANGNGRLSSAQAADAALAARRLHGRARARRPRGRGQAARSH